ncbi:MAG: hypothetical protein NTZ13_03920 [Candidatus Parcubacteria bacterium]|nr:hypothetical protein [Candidatus Parcubacteria bacterium]
MNTVYIVFQLLAAGFAVYTVFSELYRNKENLSFIWNIWRRFRLGMFLQVLVLIVVMITTAVFLSQNVPYLHYGWLNIILKNGGNIIIAPVVVGTQSPYLAVRILPPIFLFALLLAVPFMANFEERIFRKGYYTWGKMIQHSIYFGIVHLIAGISLAVAIALIIPGLFYAHKYQRTYLKLLLSVEKKEAVKEAVFVTTTYHTLTNSLLITYLLILTILAV